MIVVRFETHYGPLCYQGESENKQMNNLLQVLRYLHSGVYNESKLRYDEKTLMITQCTWIDIIPPDI